MPRTPAQYEEIRNKKKQLIMDAALELFANDGFHATSISRIAEKADISKGLMYNYFSSKEELLLTIFEQISSEIIEMMNPDHDDEMTLEEADHFFDLYFDMLKHNVSKQKLYFQLTTQPIVLEFLKNSKAAHKSEQSQILLYNFFEKLDPENSTEKMLLLTSVLKGFTIMYVSGPENFPDPMIEDFKKHLKQTFIYNLLN